MLCVMTELKVSPIHGLGVFALERIPAGTVVYRYRVFFDQEIHDSDIYFYPPIVQEFLKTYAWRDDVMWILCGDDARFINHSEEPNLVNGDKDDKDTSIAARDIEIGEELTENYRFFDDEFPSYAEELR